ncbi:MAG: penicillin-binding protein 1C [Alcanivorax sp.]|uniref:peptidoglycan glycosyltransferase n=2 Tax=Alloalcanivorax marinus TaxID=1177169 RepID=A0A9Q3UIY6_9GAMM|nr:penicillin-binding protein 1C [Alloalcanivorax marinus]MCC4308046.1 penicillin-binding protein 1C [Alloalcanivorax marinus]
MAAERRPRRRRPGWIAAALGAAVLVLAALAGLQFAPLPASLHQQAYATLMLDRQGRPLAARIAADQQWRFAPVDAVPDKYRRALITFEDRRFYAHPGVDPLAIGRAAVANARAGRVVSGGSTLTMQLARLLRDDPPRTLAEKAREALLALRLEWHLSKDRILVEYASRAPFGGNTVGLRAAAWRYFRRPPEALSWAEAALLAVLPNSPALIHPGRDRARLRAKRDRLLTVLHRRGELDADDLTLAKLEPLPRVHELPSLAPRLLDTLSAGGGGPLLRTTLDADLQRRVRDLADRHGRRLGRQGVHNLAVVVIDHRDLETRAYLGNVQHGDTDTYGAAVDIAARPRSTGSVLKPLLYGLALDAGLILPDTLIPDLPTNYGGYSPENFDREFRGAVPAHEALARSLNVPAVRLLRRYGVGRFHDQLRELGMTTLFRPADDYGLTLVLGGAEGTLEELTAIYARLIATARDGRAAPVTRLAGVTPVAAPFPISPGAAWLTLDALRDVARPGTARQWRLYRSSQPIAWKTGTSYGLRDAWAIGSNGRYTVGVWAGNGNGEPAPHLGGADTAAPLMLDVFSLLGPAPFPEPPLNDLKPVQVCADDGYLAGGRCPATTALAPLHSHFRTVTPHHRRVHLDDNGQRVHGGCEAVARMESRDWFVLPPAQAWFYRQRHPDYRPLPAWRSDCVAGARALDPTPPLAILYPHAGAGLYLPRELGGRRGRAVFRVVHERDDARLFWHLDDRYLGVTEHFHQWAIQAAPGWHTLTLVDDQGFRLQRRFKVLGD